MGMVLHLLIDECRGQMESSDGVLDAVGRERLSRRANRLSRHAGGMDATRAGFASPVEKAEAHRKAAEAHGEAAKAHRAAGETGRARDHETIAGKHAAAFNAANDAEFKATGAKSTPIAVK